MVIPALDIRLDGIEDLPRQLLRHALADRAAFNEHCSALGFDRDIPAIARNAFRGIVERCGLRDPMRLSRGLCRGNRRSVDQHARGDDQVLVDGLVAVMETDRVFAEEGEVLARRQFRDDAAAERTLGITRADATPSIVVQRRGQARGEEEQRERHDPEDQVAHVL